MTRFCACRLRDVRAELCAGCCDPQPRLTEAQELALVLRKAQDVKFEWIRKNADRN